MDYSTKLASGEQKVNKVWPNYSPPSGCFIDRKCECDNHDFTTKKYTNGKQLDKSRKRPSRIYSEEIERIEAAGRKSRPRRPAPGRNPEDLHETNPFLSPHYGPARASLDNKRIVEHSTPEALCRSEFSRYFEAVNIYTGAIYDINCRSHRCPKHRLAWGKKWGSTIGAQLEVTPATLLVNLTTAEQTTWQEIEKALRAYIRRFRNKYGETEYVKVVEMNKGHTQPHFHLIFVCKELKIPPKTPEFLAREAAEKLKPKKDQKSLSWPEDVWQFSCEAWEKSLKSACPGKRPATVTWCQPPDGAGSKAANYAVGYITGKRADEKGEELDESWSGRKLTYSKGFFTTRPADIWQALLKRWFGEPEPTRFFWQAKEDYCLENGFPTRYANMPIMKQRYFEAKFYAEHGYLPLAAQVELGIVYDNVAVAPGLAQAAFYPSD